MPAAPRAAAPNPAVRRNLLLLIEPERDLDVEAALREAGLADGLRAEVLVRLVFVDLDVLEAVGLLALDDLALLAGFFDTAFFTGFFAFEDLLDFFTFFFADFLDAIISPVLASQTRFICTPLLVLALILT